MRCSSCFGPLTPTFVSQAGIEIDLCDHCGAAWFDRHELDAYLRSHQVSGLPQALMEAGHFWHAELPSQCPSCTTLSMDVALGRGLIVGRCEACKGVFIGPRGHPRYDSDEDEDSDFTPLGIFGEALTTAFPLGTLVLFAVGVFIVGVSELVSAIGEKMERTEDMPVAEKVEQPEVKRTDPTDFRGNAF